MVEKKQANIDRVAVSQWIKSNAFPLLTIDPQAAANDLLPLATMVRDAKIVGLGESTRGARSAHELYLIKHRLLRFLVEYAGFRSLVLEGEWTKIIPLDAYLHTGVGDPRVLLAEAWGPLQTEEVLDAIRWMRTFNEQNPSDLIRVFGAYTGAVDAEAYELIAKLPPSDSRELALQYARFIVGYYEREGQDSLSLDHRFAKNTILWLEHTGHKMVYWGGIGHTANSSLIQNSDSAGSYLRKYLGAGYVSIALTFHHGSESEPIPFPSPDFAEAILSQPELETYYLDLRTDQPESVRAWLNSQTKVRVIGPYYDPEKDATFFMEGALADWFDIIIHTHKITPAQILE